MVGERFVLTDEVWTHLERHLPGTRGDSGATGKDNRLFTQASPWRVRPGSPWRETGCASDPMRAVPAPSSRRKRTGRSRMIAKNTPASGDISSRISLQSSKI